jgi:hypothetical protein
MPPSSGARLATWELRNAVSSSPFTTNFRHLLPVNKRIVQGRGEAKPGIKTAPAKDRIKWWNIVPGDQVRVMADKEGVMREVLGVNKISNRVFLQSDKKVSLDDEWMHEIRLRGMLIMTIFSCRKSQRTETLGNA